MCVTDISKYTYLKLKINPLFLFRYNSLQNQLLMNQSSLFLEIVECNSLILWRQKIITSYISCFTPLLSLSPLLHFYLDVNQSSANHHAPSFPPTVYAELRHIFTIFIAYITIILTFHANFILRDCIVKIAHNNVLTNDS